MLYKKNVSPILNPDLFRNPTAEYRCTPFWAWNDKLNADELCRQIEEMKEMGFGGFHMHTRCGMATPYLSDEFMKLIKTCNEKAKKEDMLAWLYDEDRWPSGAAGGLVTKDPQYRGKIIRFTVNPRSDVENEKAYSNYVGTAGDAMPTPIVNESVGYKQGKAYLLAAYDIVLTQNGFLKSCRMVTPGDPIEGTLWYAYAEYVPTSGWYNGQAYVDTLSDEAMQKFIEITYESYLKAVGDDFDKSIPAIFTDEPQFAHMGMLSFAASKQDINIPWTLDLPETFSKAYGFDIVPHLPELLWDLEGKPSKTRYLYHDHICERFTNAFARQCGTWCKEHGIALTGHMLAESSLLSQSMTVGETMRAYSSFGLPGIDMLCNYVELSTAKQCQSIVHQYGKEGMLSELYGVTGWDFDFRGHKFQGDWQAALGVTVRVPHLSWYSMKGSAKRDYPASIHYQSAWYKEYPAIENHFARVNTALTRGKPSVKVAVIHPVESYWLEYGPYESTNEKRSQLEANFGNVINWLLRGTIDFDFISESVLPEIVKVRDDGLLQVGEMAYEAVVMPGMETIRSTTVSALTEFVSKGGKVILMGDEPSYVDAEIPSNNALLTLCAQTKHITFSKVALLSALNEQRDIEIRSMNGALSESLIYNMRTDGDGKWLFITHVCGIDTYNPDNVRIRIKGRVKPTLYDTLTGDIKQIPYTFSTDGNTYVNAYLYATDSLLLRIENAEAGDVGYAGTVGLPPKHGIAPTYMLDFKNRIETALSEPNVLVLDIPEWSEDGQNYHAREEILRIDKQLRSVYKFPAANGQDVQPWCIPEEPITIFPYLRFTFNSTIPAVCKLAYEGLSEVILNGESVAITDDGYFTDRHIRTMPLPALKVGENVLTVRVPFGKRVSIENLFLLGDFNVDVSGTFADISAPERKISFGSVVPQGLPFYGAGLTYQLPFTLDKPSDIVTVVQSYKGALISVAVDGQPVGRIVDAPYSLETDNLPAGEHTLSLTVYLSRVNCFGALHNCTNDKWIGPEFWYTRDYKWAYEYQLKNNGILKSPLIYVYNK